eukprot:CAMPEP_0198509006 /NCGR_PEP_ID=MMETSP1462-20131121/13306_1 /TAXON_ID=1333877 /ORGANISM="Brandtodinium nutriculum, Strain RCC3387" /LENGTH=61 /DNA_ID=CAMNT_0044238299 /DNA_START=91 /DNA_END=277 /DNA_ORIENTATION=+
MSWKAMSGMAPRSFPGGPCGTWRTDAPSADTRGVAARYMPRMAVAKPPVRSGQPRNQGKSV